MNPETAHGKQPIRVLHAVEDLKIGGMERVIASIATGLDPVKYEAHVLCLTRGGTIADELINRGVPLTILGLDNYHRPGQILALCRWLRKGGFHILHTHGYFAGVFARVAGVLVGVPHTITHVHSAYTDYKKRHLFMEKFLSLWTDKIICVSKAVRGWVIEAEKIDREKTTVIYNGVSPILWDPSNRTLADALRNKLRIPLHHTVFTIIASLTPNKGHHDLLDSFRIVWSAHPDATLLIVGDGPLRSELEAKAQKLMMDQHVVFTGMQSEVHALLQISDGCLLPSRFREGLGMALIEAMAAGLPVVGTRLGGISEVIDDGENGFLISPGKPEALAAAMLRLAKNPGLRINMGQRGRKIYEEKFTLDKMIRQVETLYEQLSKDKKCVGKS